MILLCFLVKSPHFRPKSRRWASDFPPLGAEFAGGEAAAGCPAWREDSCVISMVNEYQMKNGYYKHLLTIDITEDYWCNIYCNIW